MQAGPAGRCSAAIEALICACTTRGPVGDRILGVRVGDPLRVGGVEAGAVTASTSLAPGGATRHGAPTLLVVQAYRAARRRRRRRWACQSARPPSGRCAPDPRCRRRCRSRRIHVTLGQRRDQDRGARRVRAADSPSVTPATTAASRLTATTSRQCRRTARRYGPTACSAEADSGWPPPKSVAMRAILVGWLRESVPMVCFAAQNAHLTYSMSPRALRGTPGSHSQAPGDVGGPEQPVQRHADVSAFGPRRLEYVMRARGAGRAPVTAGYRDQCLRLAAVATTE